MPMAALLASSSLPAISFSSSFGGSPIPNKHSLLLLSLRPKILAVPSRSPSAASAASAAAVAFAFRRKGRHARRSEEWWNRHEPDAEPLSPPDPLPKEEDARDHETGAGTAALAEGITDEWGEKSEPEPEDPSLPDPPEDDDEWGNEPRRDAAAPAAAITDEWGEKAELEVEEPSQPDPPQNEDEWGQESSLPVNGTPVPSHDKLGDLKRCLVDSLYGVELGLRASIMTRAEILELVSQLEAANPTPAPTGSLELLDGNWVLLYTEFSELLPLLAVGATPLLKIKRISQNIDSKTKTLVNGTTLSSSIADFTFSASASFEVQSASRIQVQFKEGSFQPPEILSTLKLPENINMFGQTIDLKPVQQTLNPVEDAAANITRSISGLPPLKVPLPGNRTESWLLITYIDEDFRISWSDGGLFVLAKEGSPLLNHLS